MLFWMLDHCPSYFPGIYWAAMRIYTKQWEDRYVFNLKEADGFVYRNYILVLHLHSPLHSFHSEAQTVYMVCFPGVISPKRSAWETSPRWMVCVESRWEFKAWNCQCGVFGSSPEVRAAACAPDACLILKVAEDMVFLGLGHTAATYKLCLFLEFL